MERKPILRVEGLQTSFFTDDGEIPAVDNISFQVYPGEILGIVGESGCGKSVTSLSIMGLLPAPQGKIKAGAFSSAMRIWSRHRKKGCGKSAAMKSR